MINVKDSHKPWAVLYMDRGNRVIFGQTDYFWTQRGARRRAKVMQDAMGPLASWTTKVVSNK